MIIHGNTSCAVIFLETGSINLPFIIDWCFLVNTKLYDWSYILRWKITSTWKFCISRTIRDDERAFDTDQNLTMKLNIYPCLSVVCVALWRKHRAQKTLSLNHGSINNCIKFTDKLFILCSATHEGVSSHKDFKLYKVDKMLDSAPVTLSRCKPANVCPGSNLKPSYSKSVITGQECSLEGGRQCLSGRRVPSWTELQLQSPQSDNECS